jgi:hypothetical protein
LKVISPDGKVIPHLNTSSSMSSFFLSTTTILADVLLGTDSLNEDRNIAMRERLTLAYTEVVALRDQCTALRCHADENAELQDDVKQLLSQRLGLLDQVEAANSACRKLEEENKKYFRQFVEIRAELTKVEKRTGQSFASLLLLALKLLLIKESRFQSSKKRRKSLKWQLKPYPKFHWPTRVVVRHLMTTLTTSPLLPQFLVIRWHPQMTLTVRFCRLMAFLWLIEVLIVSLPSEVDTPHTSVPSSPCSSLSTPPSPSFTMPSWVPCFDSECTDFAFDIVPGSPLATAISVYASIHQTIGVSHRPFVTRRGLGIPIVRPSWPSASSVVAPFDEASLKRKLALDLDDATPKTRRKHEEC